MLEAGDILDGIWVVDAQLGSGAAGSVFRVHHVTEPLVRAAVKILDRRLLSSEDARLRFAREGALLSALRHPNVVRVRGMQLHGTRPYIEMELVEGQPLLNCLGDGGLELDGALHYAEQIVTGLGHLHRHKVAHRDIKPANLIVQHDGVLRLVDFGLAVHLDGERITQEGTQFGTAAYAPPEWLTTGGPDPMAWDLYATGVVLYEMLTGFAGFQTPVGMGPWEAATQVMLDKQQVEYLDPGAEFPEPVRQLVRSLTAREPEDRPPSADAALQQLRRVRTVLGAPPPAPDSVLDGRPSPPPPPAAEPVAPRVHRDWGRVAAACYGALIAGALFGGAWLAG